MKTFLKNVFVFTIGDSLWSINAILFPPPPSSPPSPPSSKNKGLAASIKRYSANFRKTLRYSANLLLIATLKSMKINKIYENQ